MKVYLAGPVRGLPPERVRGQFNLTEVMLTNKGWEPVNPTRTPGWPACGCEPLTEGQSHGHGCRFPKDIAQLVQCDAIYLFRGWEESAGTCADLVIAISAGLRILLEEEWPLTSARPRSTR